MLQCFQSASGRMNPSVENRGWLCFLCGDGLWRKMLWHQYGLPFLGLEVRVTVSDRRISYVRMNVRRSEIINSDVRRTEIIPTKYECESRVVFCGTFMLWPLGCKQSVENKAKCVFILYAYKRTHVRTSAHMYVQAHTCVHRGTKGKYNVRFLLFWVFSI